MVKNSVVLLCPAYAQLAPSFGYSQPFFQPSADPVRLIDYILKILSPR